MKKLNKIISSMLMVAFVINCVTFAGAQVESEAFEDVFEAAGIADSTEEAEVEKETEIDADAEEETETEIETEIKTEDFDNQSILGVQNMDMQVLREVIAPDRQAAYDELAMWQDPNRISNEVFFGSYNQAAGVWVNKGYFNYDAHPKMKAIQEAAKTGDYEQVKVELLAYYREQMSTYRTSVIGGTNKVDRLTTELMEHNMHWNENSNVTLINTFTIGNEPSFVSVDLLEDVNTIMGAPDKQFTVYLAALKKDGSRAEFDSINMAGGNAPVIEYTINGITNRIVASDDTYVSPAENRNNSYGMEDKIKVEESVSSIKAYNHTIAPIDKETKRGYIKFDLSKIPANASIVNFNLKLHGSNINKTGDMKLVAFRVATNNWSEATLKYYDFEHVIFSYDGLPSFLFCSSASNSAIPRDPADSTKQFCSSRYPEELARFGTWMKHPVGMFTQAKEDNEHYAYVALKQWVGFLNQHSGTPGFSKHLDISVRSYDLPRFMRYLIMSEHMSPELWSATVKFMWASGNAMNGAKHQNNNWRTFQVKGFNAINMYFNEFNTHYAWADRLKYLANGNIDGDPTDTSFPIGLIRPDGANAEAALGYSFYAIDDMINWGVPNKEVGLETEEHLPYHLEDIAKVENGYTYMAHMLGPNYVDNQMGDGGSYKNSFKSKFITAGEFFNNDQFLYIGSDGKRGRQTDFTTSVLYDYPMRLVMRTGWNKDDMYLYTNADGGWNSHGHYDDNNMMMFAYGKYLLVDPLFYTYTTGDAIKNALMSTRMHNTVQVNTGNQSMTKLNATVDNWATNNAFDISRLTTNNYSAAYHSRNIVFVKPGFWIVSDYLNPRNTSKNTYRQHWHMLPTAGVTLDSVTGAARSNNESEANLIIAQASMEGTTGSIMTDGYYSEGTNSVTSNNYLRYEKTSTNAAVTFDTLLVPEKFGDKIDVSTEKLELENVSNDGVTAMAFEINNSTQNTITRGSYYLVHDNAQKASRGFGDYKTDSSFAYVERDRLGKLSRVMMQKGKVVSDKINQVELIKSSVDLLDLGIEYSTGVVLISSSEQKKPEDNMDITKLTFYTDRAISTVKVNGKSVSFKMSGQYVYFGDAPIIDGSDVTTPVPSATPTPSKAPSHGSSGGGGGSGGGAGTTVPVETDDTENDFGETQESNEPSELGSGNMTDSIGNTGEEFTDLYEADWAKDYINALAEKRIVSGDGNGVFNPNNSVNREEYIKMILLSLEFGPMRDVEIPFKDISQEDWAYPYVAAAYHEGIISGISDDNFGLGQPITREDMAVITVRVLEKAGVDLEGDIEPVDFNDSLSISGYAVQSIKKMQECGILNGDYDGNFKPKESTTRAESAKVVYMLLQKLKN